MLPSSRKCSAFPSPSSIEEGRASLAESAGQLNKSDMPLRARLALRARTDFPVRAHEGSFTTHCRAIELSPTGILVDRGRATEGLHPGTLLELDLELPGRAPLHTYARAVWAFGTQQALKFLAMADADRLSLAEYVDRLAREGAHLS